MERKNGEFYAQSGQKRRNVGVVTGVGVEFLFRQMAIDFLLNPIKNIFYNGAGTQTFQFVRIIKTISREFISFGDLPKSSAIDPGRQFVSVGVNKLNIKSISVVNLS